MPDVRVPEFNSANLESNVQIDSSKSALKVYVGGAWQTHTFGGANNNRDQGLLGATTPLLAESCPLWAATNNATALTTGTMLSVAMYLPKGLTVTSIGFLSGTTALAATTHATAGIYDTTATPAVVAAPYQCADQTSLTWAAYTMTKFALASPYVVPTAGVYYPSLTITGTVPTLMSTVAVPSLNVMTGSFYQTGAFDMVARSGSALAGVLPATITSSTVLTFTPWVGIF
jgi:hypothetical protein